MGQLPETISSRLIVLVIQEILMLMFIRRQKITSTIAGYRLTVATAPRFV
jgi:hypothetical protein